MAGLNHEQRRVVHRGRSFLFVSYEAEEPNNARKQPGRPASWYLVSSNNRWPAILYVPEQPGEEIDALCIAWLEAEVFSPMPAAVAAAPAPQRFLRPESDVTPR